MGKGCFVYAQLFSRILRIKHPLLGMGPLLPVLRTAQTILVLLPKVITVDVVMLLQAIGTYRAFVQINPFKKAANSFKQLVPLAVKSQVLLKILPVFLSFHFRRRTIK